MKKFVSISKMLGILVFTVSSLIYSDVMAQDSDDDMPEPGCETVISVNDFL